MQKKLLHSLFLLFSLMINAQEKNDTLQKAVPKIVSDKLPTARMLDVQFQQYLPTDYESESNGQPAEKGVISNHNRLRVAANIPIYEKPRFRLTGSLIYKFESYELSDVQDALANPVNYDSNQEFHYFSTILSYNYKATLFKKPFICNTSIIADGSNKGYERIKGNINATLVLNKTERNTLAIGLLLNLDPSAPLPAFPILTYEHKFENNPWTFDFILPQRLFFKRPLLESGRISIGAEMGGDGFYIYPNQAGYKEVYEYRQLEIKSGITYEYNLGNGLFSTFKAGFSNVLKSKITERGKSSKDYVWKSKQDGTVYFSLGISYSPRSNYDK